MERLSFLQKLSGVDLLHETVRSRLCETIRRMIDDYSKRVENEYNPTKKLIYVFALEQLHEIYKSECGEL